MVQSGIDVILLANNKPIGGQMNARLRRMSKPIEITPPLNGDWREYLGGLRGWGVSCDGVYLLDNNVFLFLEQTFYSNDQISMIIRFNGVSYKGEALITDFPVNSHYNASVKYSIELLGTGPLIKINDNNEG